MSIFCTDDGAEFFSEFEGTECGKPPLILIHGWCGNLRHWHHQVRYFRDSHRIVRVDRRGNGRSTTTGSRHTAAQLAADHTMWVSALRLSSPTWAVGRSVFFSARSFQPLRALTS